MAFIKTGGSDVEVQSEVSIDGALPIPSSEQIIINELQTCATSSITTIYTVPENKVFYLMGWTAGRNGADTYYLSLDGSFIYKLQSSTTQYYPMIVGSTPIAKFRAGEVVGGESSTGTGTFQIWGVLVDV